jgi:hypothetical protein
MNMTMNLLVAKKIREFLEWMSNCWLLRKAPDTWP